MKKLALALLVLLCASFTPAKASDEMCHDVYTYSEKGVVIIADTASRAPGAFHNAFRLYDGALNWKFDLKRKHWHAQLCFTKTDWDTWKNKYPNGLSLCVREPGIRVDCKTLTGAELMQFLCQSTRFVFHEPEAR